MNVIKIILISTLVLISTFGLLQAQTHRFGIGSNALVYLVDGYSFSMAYVIGKYELNVGHSRHFVPQGDDVRDGYRVENKFTYVQLKYNLEYGVKNGFIALIAGHSFAEGVDEIYDASAEFKSPIFGGSVGYNISISDHLRLIPSISFGFLTIGKEKKQDKNIIFEVDPFVKAVSLNVMYYF